VSLVGVIRRHDPNGTAARRALRATLVVPALFAATLAFGSDTTALYVLFGGFAHLVFGDYGGPPPLRASSYLATTVIGLGLIALGTAVSEHVVVAALVTVVVGFSISLAGVLGPVITKLRTPLLLAFVLPASVAAPFGDVGPRLVGWGLSGVVSLAAAFLLFPRRDEAVVAEVAADACDGLANALAAGHGAPLPALDRLEPAKALATASAFAPTARRRSFVVILQELQSFGRFLPDLPAEVPGDPVAHDRLVAVVTATLHECAAALRGRGAPSEVEPLDGARAVHRDALQQWAEGELRAGRPATEVLDELDTERTLRLLSNITLGIAAATRVVRGAALPDDWADVAPRPVVAIGQESGVRRSAEVLRSHLSLTSVRFRDALRAGVAFGIAVFVAGIGNVEHGFWVVLGALTVLRTSVLAGGRSAAEAVGGTVVGFVAVIPIVWLAGSATVTQWILLPPCTLLAAFAAGVLPYAVGQAAFTVFVVMAVNIIEPDGWHTGAVRVRDVIIGAGVALVAGLLFWPRGARLQARAAIGDLYRVTAAMLAGAFHHVLAAQPAAGAAVDHDDWQALDRARAAVSDLSAERGHTGPGVAASARLVVTAAVVRAAAERIALLRPIRAAAPAAVLTDVDGVIAAFRDVADALESGGALSVADHAPVDVDRRQATAERLATDFLSPDAGVRADAFTLVWAGEWVVDLARMTAGLEAPVRELVGV
jgi:hypothetical protein